MKLTALATASVLALGTAVSAAEIGNTGVSIGAELDNRYNVETEDMTVTLTPKVGYAQWGASFEASTDIVFWNNEFTMNNEVNPTVDFTAKYSLELLGITSSVYGETVYDLEAEDMSDVEVGVTFSF